MTGCFETTGIPVGQRLRPCCGDRIPRFTIAGVAKNAKQGGVNQTAYDQGPIANAPATMNIVLRTTLPPAALASTVENTVRQADASVPVVRLRDMDDVFAESIRRPGLLAARVAGVVAGQAWRSEARLARTSPRRSRRR